MKKQMELKFKGLVKVRLLKWFTELTSNVETVISVEQSLRNVIHPIHKWLPIKFFFQALKLAQLTSFFSW